MTTTSSLGESALDGRPDFAALFPMVLGSDEPQLTPRSASALYTALCVLADGARLDVDHHGGEPIMKRYADEWRVLPRLPRVSWRQGDAWRRRAADAAQRLVDDVGNGRLIRSRCIAEELFLRLATEDAEDEASEAASDPGHPSRALPEHLDDYLWDVDAFFSLSAGDLQLIDDPQAAEIADPGTGAARVLQVGRLAPGRWFEPFEGEEGTTLFSQGGVANAAVEE